MQIGRRIVPTLGLPFRAPRLTPLSWNQDCAEKRASSGCRSRGISTSQLNQFIGAVEPLGSSKNQ
jgi:hypothetical protein